MSLARVPFGARFRVTGVRLVGPLSHRLMEMGLIRGAEVQVLRCAPLGDPLQLRVGDYELSVRKSEAELVDVAVV